MTQQAVELFNDVISSTPENPDLRINLASAYFEAGMLDNALIEFQNAVNAGRLVGTCGTLWNYLL